MKLTQARLKELLYYDPDLGWFTWRVPVKGTKGVGSVAGTLSKGYTIIGIDYGRYRAGRLAWFYSTGLWPRDEIDHRDTNPSNDSFTNLREADGGQNLQNKQRAHSNNRLGILGVRILKGRFTSRIAVRRKTKHLGYFNTADDAHQAYLKAKKELHPFQEIAR